MFQGMMIVGFDVSHDIQRKNSSYGALVATMNDEHTSYFSCVEAHKSGEELSNYIRMSISSKYIFVIFCPKVINIIVENNLSFCNPVKKIYKCRIRVTYHFHTYFSG